jgi:hypothetical protein
MQEQHENNTDLESEFEALFAEAKALDVHIPSWVPKPYGNLYKFAYLQVKKDKGCEGMSARKRTDLITGLMNMYHKKIMENTFEKEPVQTGLAVEESVSDSKETQKHCPVVI